MNDLQEARDLARDGIVAGRRRPGRSRHEDIEQDNRQFREETLNQRYRYHRQGVVQHAPEEGRVEAGLEDPSPIEIAPEQAVCQGSRDSHRRNMRREKAVGLHAHGKKRERERDPDRLLVEGSNADFRPELASRANAGRQDLEQGPEREKPGIEPDHTDRRRPVQRGGALRENRQPGRRDNKAGRSDKPGDA